MPKHDNKHECPFKYDCATVIYWPEEKADYIRVVCNTREHFKCTAYGPSKVHRRITTTEFSRAVVYLADGNIRPLGHRPTLKEAQEIVGGYIELVPVGHRTTLVVDEMGRLKNKPRNRVATNIYHQGNQLGSIDIVGDVIILRGWRTVG
jgi:hypothetical protein